MRDEKNCLKRALQVKPVVRQSADGVELQCTELKHFMVKYHL